jgi:hypothetical protein
VDLGSINVRAGTITQQRDKLTWQATEYEVFAYIEYERELLKSESMQFVNME